MTERNPSKLSLLLPRLASSAAHHLNPTRKRMAYITLGVLVLALGGLMAVEVIWDLPDMVLGLAVGVIGGFPRLVCRVPLEHDACTRGA